MVPKPSPMCSRIIGESLRIFLLISYMINLCYVNSMLHLKSVLHLSSNVLWAWYRACLFLEKMPFNKMKSTVKRFLFSFLFLLCFFVRLDMKQFCCPDWFTSDVTSRSFVMTLWLKFTLIALDFCFFFSERSETLLSVHEKNSSSD